MPASQLDATDRKIIEILARDGRCPYTSIAGSLGVTEGTVRNRVNRLLKSGILKIRGAVDPQTLGKGISAIVGIQVNADNLQDIVEVVADMPEVQHAVITAGMYDLILEVSVGSTNELYEFLTKQLREVAGVVRSDTSLTLKVVKDRQVFRG